MIGVLVGILAVVVTNQSRVIKKQRHQIEVQSSNIDVLTSKAETYKFKDSLNAVSIRTLRFSIDEYKKYRAKDYKDITQLIKEKKRLQSIINTSTTSKYDVKTILRDSIVLRDSIIIDTIKTLRYKSEWLNFETEISGDTGRTLIQTFEKLRYVEHIVPHKFLFFRWGVKSRRQEIISLNPHTTILDSEFVKIIE